MPFPQARELATREREHFWPCRSCFVFLCFMSIVDAFCAYVVRDCRMRLKVFVGTKKCYK